MKNEFLMLKILIKLSVWLVLAGYSMDRIIDWLWSAAIGVNKGLGVLTLSVIGLIVGFFFFVRIIYRYDKKVGKIRNEIKILELGNK